MTGVEKTLWGIQQRLMRTLAMAMTYTSWSTEYKLKECAEAFSPDAGFGRGAVTPLTIADLKTLSRETLYQYGFGNFDGDLILIPLHFVPFIKGDEEVIDIMGDKTTLAAMDKDVRYGCIAAGFKL